MWFTKPGFAWPAAVIRTRPPRSVEPAGQDDAFGGRRPGTQSRSRFSSAGYRGHLRSPPRRARPVPSTGSRACRADGLACPVRSPGTPHTPGSRRSWHRARPPTAGRRAATDPHVMTAEQDQRSARGAARAGGGPRATTPHGPARARPSAQRRTRTHPADRRPAPTRTLAWTRHAADPVVHGLGGRTPRASRVRSCSSSSSPRASPYSSFSASSIGLGPREDLPRDRPEVERRFAP